MLATSAATGTPPRESEDDGPLVTERQQTLTEQLSSLSPIAENPARLVGSQCECHHATFAATSPRRPGGGRMRLSAN